MVVNRHLRRRSEAIYGTIRRRIYRTTRKRQPVVFTTATGTPIEIVDRVYSGVVVQSSRPAYNAKSNERKLVTLTWKEIRKAVDLLVVVGLVDRKRLEGANAYSSALMGLLVTFLRDKVRKVRTGTGKVMLRLIRVRIFISGCERDPQVLDKMDTLGGAYVLLSYVQLKRKRTPSGKPLKGGSLKSGGLPPSLHARIQNNGWVTMYDPGAFSMKGTQETIPLDGFLSFLDAAGANCYVALDVIGDLEATRANLKEMLRRGYRQVMPVYHYGAPPEYLRDLVRQGFDVIGLGGVATLPARQRDAWFNSIFAEFPEQPFHGFGIGTVLAAMYPFFSVDTTNWRVGRAAGKCLTDWGQRRAAVPGMTAVEANLTYLLTLADRSERQWLQRTWLELLDDRVAQTEQEAS